MSDARRNRSAWFCPNGHPDWQRPTAEQIAEQGENLELECGDCGARWKADAEQRSILRRYHGDKASRPPAVHQSGKR
jgi:hypothetical protein